MVSSVSEYFYWHRCVRPASGEIKTDFREKRKCFTHERTGNLVHAYERDSEQDGVQIHLYYWIVANVVEPNLVREAVFSYTVLHERVNDENTVRIVGLLRQLVSQAYFNPAIQTPD